MSMGMGLQAIGTGMSMFGQMQQGRAYQSAANYNAAVSEQQARIYEQAGELEAYKIERKGKQIAGTQRARYAASGVRTIGSPAEVMADTYAQVLLDMDIARYNASIGAMQARSQAAMTRWEGSQMARASNIGAMTTLLGGVGRIAQNYYTGGLTVSKKDK